MVVALSFDDGPDLNVTPKVLDILEFYGVKASFFICGKNLTKETVGVVRRAVKLGCSIENHGWTHTSFADLDDERIKKEVTATSAIIEKATGRKSAFLRPPYLAYKTGLSEMVGLPVIFGAGVDDWKTDMPAAQKAKAVVEQVCDGQIILLHDFGGNETTVEALKVIVPALLTLGCEFCTVPELFEKCGKKAVPSDTCWTVLK